MMGIRWIKAEIAPPESNEYYTIAEALQDIVDPITKEVFYRKGDIEIGGDWYNADTGEFSTIGGENPFWRVLAWAEIPKPPIPEEIRPRVKCYFGAKVEG